MDLYRENRQGYGIAKNYGNDGSLGSGYRRGKWSYESNKDYQGRGNQRDYN